MKINVYHTLHEIGERHYISVAHITRAKTRELVMDITRFYEDVDVSEAEEACYRDTLRELDNIIAVKKGSNKEIPLKLGLFQTNTADDNE